MNHREATLSPTPAANMSRPYFETDIQTAELADGITMRVAVSDGRPGGIGPDIITLQPWSGFVDRADVRDGQLRVIAHALGARVVAPDNLGIGDGTSQIPRPMHQDLRNGNFAPLATVQWDVMQQIVPDLSSHPHAFSFSQGSTLQAELAAQAPAGVQFDDMMFLETVDARPVSMPQLVRRFGRIIADSIVLVWAFVRAKKMKICPLIDVGEDPLEGKHKQAAY